MNRPLVTVDAMDVDTACRRSEGCPQYEETRRRAVATALAELEEWAMGILDNALSEDGDKITTERRANYVAYLRVVMAIEQLNQVAAVTQALQHPKRDSLIDALKVWANKLYAAAEPHDRKVIFNTRK